MAAYEVLAQQQNLINNFEEISNFIAYKPRKSFRPSYKIKKILKSVRKFFKKQNEFNGDASILEILSNDHQEQPTTVNYLSEEEQQNLENERLEAANQ